MKRLLTLALILVPLLSMAQDDLYFTPSKKAKGTVQQQMTASMDAARKRAVASMDARTETVTPPTVVDYHSNTRSEDEYNRRYVYGGDMQNAGGAYADDSLAASIDTLYGVQPGYDLNDPELDYRYSRRIVRFHSPRIYALTSPYYWDLYYGYGAWDYLYDPWDPWYWHYGWSYGWSWGPWDCWYGSIWGWSHPYSWTYWGWGPGWSRPVYYTSYYRNTVPREFNSSRGHMAAGNRIRTNAGGGRTITSRTNVGSVTSRTNVAGGRTDMGSRTQIYNGAVREGNGRRSVGTVSNNYPTRSYSNQGSSSRVQVQQPTRTQVQPSRTHVQQPTRTQQPQTRTQVQQPQTRTQVQQPTRTYTPAPATRSSSGSFGGGGSFGGATRSGGGSVGGGGRSGGGRR
ncbi:MAG: hypothetical protein J6Y38_06625 [Bacteroidaceae bacterium]|nr:hypothetical protein [Bacteroidaceae bacterium]